MIVNVPGFDDSFNNEKPFERNKNQKTIENGFFQRDDNSFTNQNNRLYNQGKHASNNPSKKQ